MTKHIIITSDRKKNNISVYSQEPAVVVVADRSDMNSLRKLEEANQAGVYILIGESKRYIGQASNQVYKRLVMHDNSKEWWNKVIFFGREDGHLDKSQTDYLEKLLIEMYVETSFCIENGTIGNTSYIDKMSRIKADNVWHIVQEILEEVANINLFENSSNEVIKENQEKAEKENFIIRESNGLEFVNKSARANYIDFVTYYYLSDEHHETLARTVVQEKPTVVNILGRERNIVPSGSVNTVEIAPGIFLYTNFSTKNRNKAIIKLAKFLNIEVEIVWPD